MFLAAAAAAASTGTIHATSSSSSMSSLPSTILGASRSSLLSPPTVNKEEKMASGLSTSGISAACSSTHGIHSHPPVGAVGPMPHIGITIRPQTVFVSAQRKAERAAKHTVPVEL